MGTAVMRVVQGAAIGLLAAVLCVSAVVYVQHGSSSMEEMLQDSSILGSAVRSTKATIQSLYYEPFKGRVHIEPSHDKYIRRSPSALYDRPEETAARLASPARKVTNSASASPK